MAIVIQRASQSYNARVNPYTINANIPAGTTVNWVKVRLTREAWPEGHVASITLTFPDGSTAGFTVSGGTVLKRDGTVLTESTCTFEKVHPITGQPIPFPAGAYSLSFKVDQTVTTAVTVERS